MNGFKSQQRSLDERFDPDLRENPSLRFWRSDLPLHIQIEATAHLTANFAYLLLVFLCVLLNPTNDGLGHGMWRAILLDIPNLCRGLLSSAIFYFCAQRTLYPKALDEGNPVVSRCWLGWRHPRRWRPNNARAVLEAMFNHQSEFTRTPKYGIRRASRINGARAVISPLKSMLPFVELGFAIYFSYFVVIALMHGQYLSLPFLILFQGGFGYVAVLSFAQWLPRVSVPDREPGDPLPA